MHSQGGLCVAIVLVLIVSHIAAFSPHASSSTDKSNVGSKSRGYQRNPMEGRFWVITDMHYDNEYAPGSEVHCGEPLCCRNSTNTTHVTKHVSEPAGRWGNLKCDPPTLLVESILNAMSELEGTPDFIVWLGDNVKHDIWTQSRAENLEASLNCTKFIMKYFPGTPVFPTIGNHEAYPSDQFSAPPGMSWLYDTLSDYWEQWLPGASSTTFEYGGYYEALQAPGLRVVSLNLMYCDPLNFYLYSNDTDPAGQLAWLNGVLQRAKAAKEKVLIISHIPPEYAPVDGTPVCLPTYSAHYSDIVSNYSSIIVGQLFGHTHQDNFIIFKQSPEHVLPVNVGTINPSLTPYVGHNPSVRLITYDIKSKEFTNMFTYYVDLNATNEQDKLVFELEYNTLDAYQMPDLSPKSFYMLSEQLHNDTAVFNLYYDHFFVKDTSHHCNAVCRKLIYCSSQNVGAADHFTKCLL